MMTSRTLSLLTWGLLSALTFVPARADLALVTSPGALGPNDVIDWGQLGPDFTFLPSTVNVTSLFGLNATVSTTDVTGLLRLDQSDTSWPGNFLPGERLLTTNTADYFPLTIDFASPVYGAGANIQLDSYEPFTATIEAFSGSTSLGVFTHDGVSNDLADGSAIFIGVLDAKAEITRIVFGIQNPPAVAGDFIVNSLRVLAVPEPSMCSLAVIGGLTLLIGRGARNLRLAAKGSRFP